MSVSPREIEEAMMEAITSMDHHEAASEQFETEDRVEGVFEAMGLEAQVAQTMDIHSLSDQIKQLKVLLTNERTRTSKQAQAMQANIRKTQGEYAAADLRAVAHEKSAIDATTKLNNMKAILNIAKQDLKTARKTIAHVQATQVERIEAIDEAAAAA